MELRNLKMTQAYRNSAEINGVWFLEESQVLELDSKIESHFEDLKRMRQCDIAAEVRQERKRLREFGKDENVIKTEIADFKKKVKERRPHSEEYKTVVIKSGNKDIAVRSSFAEVVAGPEIHKENPTGFVVKVKAGKNSSEFSLNEGLFTNHVKIKVEPDSEPTAAFLVEIERWAEAHRVNRFLQWWHRNWMVFPMLASLLLIVAGPIVDSKITSNDGVIAARAEARKLIDEGITDSNRDKALSTLLRLEVDTSPTVTRRFSPWWALTVFATAVFVLIVGFMPPRSILGIGRGKNVLYWRKKWFWFWTKFIPFGVVGTLAGKMALDLLKDSIMGK
jgi:hypothetical protein